MALGRAKLIMYNNPYCSALVIAAAPLYLQLYTCPRYLLLLQLYQAISQLHLLPGSLYQQFEHPTPAGCDIVSAIVTALSTCAGHALASAKEVASFVFATVQPVPTVLMVCTCCP